MIPSIARPIRADRLAEALRAALPAGREPPSDDAGTAFAAVVLQSESDEGELRCALAWLLNQPDSELAAAVDRLGLFPEPVDAAAARRWLESLWVAAFSDWRIDGFSPSAYRVVAE